MRILCVLLLSVGSTVFNPANAADALDFQGVVVAVNGSIIEVDQGSSVAPLYVRADTALSETAVGKTVSGTCVMRGDLCTATVLNVEE